MTLRSASPSTTSQSLSHRVWPWAALVVVIALYFISARWHVYYGALNTDEGFYAITTRSVAQGEMPYRDFGFTQPPAVLYANALPLKILGFGLFTQRIVNGAWSALALIIAAGWLVHRTNRWWAFGLVMLFSLSAPWMHFTHLGKTYAITTLLATLSTWVFLALKTGPRRNFLVGLLAIAGIASRLPAAPFFGLLWCGTLWPGRRPTRNEVLAAVGGIVAGFALFVLPFWLAAPESFKFWVFDFHRASVPNKDWNLSWREIGALAPAVWTLGLLAVSGAIYQRKQLSRETCVLLAAGVALAFNLLPAGVYGEYSMPFLLPLAMAALSSLHDMPMLKATWSRFSLGAALLVVQLGAAPLLQASLRPERIGTINQWLPAHAPPYKKSLPDDLRKARDIVKTILPETAPFVGSNIILAAETGHFVPRELRMGPFSWTNEMSRERAAQLHLATRDQLDAWFAQSDVTLLVFFQRWDLNYGWSMPSFDRESVAIRTAQMHQLMSAYRLAFYTEDFYILERHGITRPATASKP